MEQFEFLHNGSLYSCDNADLAKVQTECLDKLWEFNQTRPCEMAKREDMLKDMFAALAREGVSVQYAGVYRQELLDRCRSNHHAGRDDWR